MTQIEMDYLMLRGIAFLGWEMHGSQQIAHVEVRGIKYRIACGQSSLDVFCRMLLHG